VSASGSTFPWLLVTVDIDGTLTRVHGWREIAMAFGRVPEYEGIDRRFRADELDRNGYVARLIDLARGRTLSEVEEVLSRTPKLDGIGAGVARLRALGCRTALLTHNPTYVTDWYRATFGFDDAEGTPTPPIGRGPIGPVGRVGVDKRRGLAGLVARAAVPPSAVAHVGDGPSDAELFPLVGGGVALNSSSAAVRAAADIAISTTDFRDVVDALGRLSPRA
jgi:phosphoserine phosphatase